MMEAIIWMLLILFGMGLVCIFALTPQISKLRKKIKSMRKYIIMLQDDEEEMARERKIIKLELERDKQKLVNEWNQIRVVATTLKGNLRANSEDLLTQTISYQTFLKSRIDHIKQMKKEYQYNEYLEEDEDMYNTLYKNISVFKNSIEKFHFSCYDPEIKGMIDNTFSEN